MAIFETTALDCGVVNSVPSKGVGGVSMPATVVTTAANNSGTITGQLVGIAGAMEDMEYTIISPPYQIDGTTSASGSFVTTFTFYAQDGSTSLGTVVGPTVNCNATVNGATVGSVFTYRLAVPMAQTGSVTLTATPNLSGATISVPKAPAYVRAVTVITSTCGALTAGWTMGGHRRNRAG